MGLTQPRQLIVNVDEDHDLACEDVSWGYTPYFVLTVDPSGMFEVKTKGPMDDEQVVAILYEVIQNAIRNGIFPDPKENDERNIQSVPEVRSDAVGIDE